MSVDRFRFVSPGVFINEIDRSQVPRAPVVRPGPAIIGRAARGPALKPVTINSFNEFVETFGNPIPGGKGGDVWAEGNYSAPTYAAYAAQAYLANDGPINFVRLLGDQSDSPTSVNIAKAGWNIPDTSTTAGTGVYGLWIFPSASIGQGTRLSGTLAAKFYVSGAANVMLSGTTVGGTTGSALGAIFGASKQARGSSRLLTTVDSGGKQEFKIMVTNASYATQVAATFNFDRTSGRYIRKVFNTNPQLCNTTITPSANQELYWLGETYDRNIRDALPSYGSTTVHFGVLLGMGSGSSYSAGDFRMRWQKPETPPIIAQSATTGSGVSATFNLNNTPAELFKVVALDSAEWLQNNVKISIIDVKNSPNPDYEAFGTFGLQVRKLSDVDTNPQILEQFNNLNLNPNSPNYIARKVGDMFSVWDTTLRKYRDYGEYPNQSKYIRVDMLSWRGSPEHLLPFGYKGIPKPIGFNYSSGSGIWNALNLTASSGGTDANALSEFTTAFTQGSGSVFAAGNAVDAGDFQGELDVTNGLVSLALSATPVCPTASFQFPVLPVRVSGTDGGISDPTNAYWGMSTTKSRTSIVFEPSVREHLRVQPSEFERTAVDSDNFLERGPGFSLDDLCRSSAGITDVFHSGSAYANQATSAPPAEEAAGGIYSPWAYAQNPPAAPLGPDGDGGAVQLGAYAQGTSINAVSGTYTGVLDLGYDRFTVPMFGGFDGLDIANAEPFANTIQGVGAPGTTPSERDNAMYYSVKKAIDTIADTEVVDTNLLALPGITNIGLTNHALTVAEERADTLAVIDLEGGYTSSYENTDSFATRGGSSATVVANIKARALNNSYGACYYPWVQAVDSLSGVRLWMPPSVVAVGTYASSARRSELWFAPAGFNRGGLTQGSAGIPVVGVIEKLSSKQRDNLYEVNINPIASFPNEGIVIFGQKTLQATPSALDRVNVRRLLIFLKKQISRIATTILFDPNVQVTWDRFLAQVNPLLKSVQSRFGLQEYRVVLDQTTTTPELIDRNIMYAKVFLKPTRAIEFIALDFIITRTGASFDD